MLTDRQREVYDFIRQRVREGVPPTVREIMKPTGIKCPNGVHGHLRALKKKGYIDWNPKLSRSIRLLKEPKEGQLLDPDGVIHDFSDLFRDGNCINQEGEVFNRRGKKIAEIARVK